MRLLIKFETGQGVGNQLWNYVTIYNYAFYNGLETEIDTSSCAKICELLGDIEFKSFHHAYKGNEFHTYKLKAKFILDDVFVNEESISDALSEIKRAGRPELVWVKGVMQNISALDGFENTPLHEYIKKYVNRSRQDTPKFLMHIRGGDFLATTSCLTGGYYKEALKLAAKISYKNPSIVTNDISYSNYLFPRQKIFSDSLSSLTNADHHIGGHVGNDFLALANADCLILSNSTFAFWAAYFSNAVIFAPKYWFANNYSLDAWSPDNAKVENWNYIESTFFSLPSIHLKDFGVFSKLLYKVHKYTARARSIFLRIRNKTDWRPL